MTKKVMAISFFVVFALVIAFSSAVNAQSMEERLTGTWKITVRSTNWGYTSGTISFYKENSVLKGKLVSSSYTYTILGPLENLNVDGDRVSFKTPNGTNFELKFDKNRLIGSSNSRGNYGTVEMEKQE